MAREQCKFSDFPSRNVVAEGRERRTLNVRFLLLILCVGASRGEGQS